MSKDDDLLDFYKDMHKKEMKGHDIEGGNSDSGLEHVMTPTNGLGVHHLWKPEPAPIANSLPSIWDLVIIDMGHRDDFGRKKYGTPLQPHNGRDVLKDAYQEALDLCVYLRQALYERDGS